MNSFLSGYYAGVLFILGCSIGTVFFTGLFWPLPVARKKQARHVAPIPAAPFVAEVRPAGISGIASWYGEHYAGRIMANGERFDPEELTCATERFPLGVWLEVTLTQPGFPARTVVVQVTDRGPAPQYGRLLDLSQRAFRRLHNPAAGLVRVTVREIEAVQ